MDKIKQFLQTTSFSTYKLSLASADASFRKYYRLSQGKKSYILMDSSLERESLTPFIDITYRLQSANIKVPHIYEKNIHNGFLILEDFGDKNLLDVLNSKNFKHYYTNAIEIIIEMQNSSTQKLPLYDEDFLHFEMQLMQEWYIEGILDYTLSQEELLSLKKSLKKIVQVVLTQPQSLFVHRDFHSRNIMLTPDNSLAIIDYQDAMSGALTYDLVSLLKDCYIKFPRQDIEKLALLFRDKKGLNVDDKEFLKWFDFMGLQRHIKVLGIFSRLSLRDKKDDYLKDIPLVLEYILESTPRYAETQAIANILQKVNS